MCNDNKQNENTDQKKQVINALSKWAERLNKWEYAIQVKRNKGKKLKQYNPQYYSLIIIQAENDFINGKISADDAMSYLHTPEGSANLRQCMEAGF